MHNRRVRPYLLGDQSAQIKDIRAVRADQAMWSFSASRPRCAG